MTDMTDPAVHESPTLQQLRRRYTLPYLLIDDFRREYLPEIATRKHLLDLVREEKLKIKFTRLRPSKRAPLVITLPELARWLDEQLGLGKPTNAAEEAA